MTELLGQRCVFFSAVNDESCREFAACGPGYTALLSADVNQSGPGGEYYASDAQIAVLRSRGGSVWAWCDGTGTPIGHAQAFAASRGLDDVCGQYETLAEWEATKTAGLGLAIGNPSNFLHTPQLAELVAFASLPGHALIGEVLVPNPAYTAQGVNVASCCYYVDQDEALGGYRPLAEYASQPAGQRAVCSVYGGGRMMLSDWQTFRAWTAAPAPPPPPKEAPMTLQLPSSFKATHQTAGLPGFPAIDVFAAGGSPVASPCTGKVVKLSGKAPTATAKPGGPYGWSIYIERREGGTFFLTHFGKRSAFVKVGACIGRGEIIGTVADYAKATGGKTPSHIHQGFHAGPWAP